MKIRIPEYLIDIAILIILFQFGFLFIHNKVLKNQTKSDRNYTSASLIGTYASPIKLIDINKRVEEINFRNPNEKILLLILPQSCVPCDKNFIFWNRLTFQLRGKVRIIGIIMIGESDEASFHDQARRVDFPLYMPEDKEVFISAYRISNLSKTMLINEQGKIQWVKSGNLNREDYIRIKKLANGNFN